MEDPTLTGQLRRLIWEEMRFHMHYIGEVVDNQDPDTKGRVRVKIPDIGWDTNAKGQWCWPRQLHAMDVPKVGEWVEVYFIAGDRNRAVYMGQAVEITGQLPIAYSDPDKRLLFQDPDSGDNIQYDSQAEALLFTASEIHLNGDGKHLVTFEDLDTALSNFKTSISSSISGAITGHTHSGVTTGPGVSGPGTGVAPTITIDISASKTDTLKTDG